VLTLLAIAVPSMTLGDRGGPWLLLLIMGLPVVLLGGAVVAAFRIAVGPSSRGDIREWKRLGSIIVGVVVGGLIGGFLMWPLFR
jgi:hypothetical protein